MSTKLHMCVCVCVCVARYVVGKKDKCAAHAQGNHIPNVILKDCDLYSKFQIGYERAFRISLQLERDSRFLMQRNIMDYSLLVGIHNKQVQVTWRSLDKDYKHNEGEWSYLLSSGDSEIGATGEGYISSLTSSERLGPKVGEFKHVPCADY